jgi:hypothetical protein
LFLADGWRLIADRSIWAYNPKEEVSRQGDGVEWKTGCRGSGSSSF